MGAAAGMRCRTADAADELGLEALLLSRTFLYGLFHKLLGGRPSNELLDALLGDRMADAVGEYAASDGTMRGLEAFLAKLRGRADRAALLDEAKDEYTRLFIGPAELLAEPFASVYQERDRAVFHASTLAVRSAYRSCGLQPRALHRVPDDHISLLCCFAALRAQESLAALRAGEWDALACGLDEQAAFCREHLRSWLPDYAKKLRFSRTAVLYPQMVEALASFVRLDGVFMGEAAQWAKDRVEAEELRGMLVDSEADLGSERPLSFALMDEALADLRALRLFGLDENELVPAAA